MREIHLLKTDVGKGEKLDEELKIEQCVGVCVKSILENAKIYLENTEDNNVRGLHLLNPQFNMEILLC